MKEKWNLWEGLDLPGETLPGQVLVEIAGQNRVLIENHQGVGAYSPEKIGVRVKYGAIEVTGDHLELRHMTKEQLVITGQIDGVRLNRRDIP